MNTFLHGVVRAAVETFHFPTPILEVGAYQVPGQEAIANLRPLFAEQPYVGVDARPGRGVDCVANIEALPQTSASVGSVLALNTFEHVRHFWRGFDELYRVARPDSALIVSCPFYFHIHNHPDDFWRFTPTALEVLLERWPHKILGWQGDSKRPLHVWAIAFREQHAPITPTQFATYRRLLSCYARQPLSWGRKLRYQLGRLLCGRRPFAPFLEQDSWESTCPSLIPRFSTTSPPTMPSVQAQWKPAT